MQPSITPVAIAWLVIRFMTLNLDPRNAYRMHDTRVGFHPIALFRQLAKLWSLIGPELLYIRNFPPAPNNPQLGQSVPLYTMENNYFQKALEVVGDPDILVNMVWGRVRMLRAGNCPLVESDGKLPPEDIALREIIDGRITYILGEMVVLDDIVGLKAVVVPAY